MGGGLAPPKLLRRDPPGVGEPLGNLIPLLCVSQCPPVPPKTSGECGAPLGSSVSPPGSTVPPPTPSSPPQTLSFLRSCRLEVGMKNNVKWELNSEIVARHFLKNVSGSAVNGAGGAAWEGSLGVVPPPNSPPPRLVPQLRVFVPPHAVKLPEEPITRWGEYWCDVTVSGPPRPPPTPQTFSPPPKPSPQSWHRVRGAKIIYLKEENNQPKAPSLGHTEWGCLPAPPRGAEPPQKPPQKHLPHVLVPVTSRCLCCAPFLWGRGEGPFPPHSPPISPPFPLIFSPVSPPHFHPHFHPYFPHFPAPPPHSRPPRIWGWSIRRHRMGQRPQSSRPHPRGTQGDPGRVRGGVPRP